MKSTDIEKSIARCAERARCKLEETDRLIALGPDAYRAYESALAVKRAIEKDTLRASRSATTHLCAYASLIAQKVWAEHKEHGLAPLMAYKFEAPRYCETGYVAEARSTAIVVKTHQWADVARAFFDEGESRYDALAATSVDCDRVTRVTVRVRPKGQAGCCGSVVFGLAGDDYARVTLYEDLGALNVGSSNAEKRVAELIGRAYAYESVIRGALR